MLRLVVTKRTDVNLLDRMKNHYSKPKGFVGRNICLAIFYNDTYYGHIVYGSATRFLPGRNEHLGVTLETLNIVANNIFFNISKVDDKYPRRNFTSYVLNESMNFIVPQRYNKYGDKLIGFETLVEVPRTGDLYIRAGWTKVGETKGYTCKRVSGNSTDTWTGKRVWNTDKNDLRPKIVLVKKL